MSWLFSRAMVEDCLLQGYSDGEPSALSSWIGTADAFLHSDKMSDNYDPRSLYGMTLVPLTADRGVAQLMSYLEDFLVKHTVQQREEGITQNVCGVKCRESLEKCDQDMSLQKTYQEKQLTGHVKTLRRWVTKPTQFPLARKTWVLTTFGSGIGYLHTPTTKANYCANSMQKHPGCRNYVTVFGVASPENQEWLMGWPEGWSDTRELETDKFQLWLQRHYI